MKKGFAAYFSMISFIHIADSFIIIQEYDKVLKVIDIEYRGVFS